jgi:hypothetical protein
MLTPPSGNQPAPAAEITETATNPPGGDTNPGTAPALSSPLVKPPWPPPQPAPPPFGLGMTNPTVVPPAGLNRNSGPSGP